MKNVFNMYFPNQIVLTSFKSCIYLHMDGLLRGLGAQCIMGPISQNLWL